MWKYESPIGTLYIKRLNNGYYGLIYNNTVWDMCPSPQAVADNVYTHSSGCVDWDSLAGHVLDAPTDIYEWEKI